MDEKRKESSSPISILGLDDDNNEFGGTNMEIDMTSMTHTSFPIAITSTGSSPSLVTTKGDGIKIVSKPPAKITMNIPSFLPKIQATPISLKKPNPSDQPETKTNTSNFVKHLITPTAVTVPPQRTSPKINNAINVTEVNSKPISVSSNVSVTVVGAGVPVISSPLLSTSINHSHSVSKPILRDPLEFDSFPLQKVPSQDPLSDHGSGGDGVSNIPGLVLLNSSAAEAIVPLSSVGVVSPLDECDVPGCKRTRSENVPLFTIPRSGARKWCEILGIAHEDLLLKDITVLNVCSDHFDSSQFLENSSCRELKASAVPKGSTLSSSIAKSSVNIQLPKPDKLVTHTMRISEGVSISPLVVQNIQTKPLQKTVLPNIFTGYPPVAESIASSPRLPLPDNQQMMYLSANCVVESSDNSGFKIVAVPTQQAATILPPPPNIRTEKDLTLNTRPQHSTPYVRSHNPTTNNRPQHPTPNIRPQNPETNIRPQHPTPIIAQQNPTPNTRPQNPTTNIRLQHPTPIITQQNPTPIITQQNPTPIIAQQNPTPSIRPQLNIMQPQINPGSGVAIQKQIINPQAGQDPLLQQSVTIRPRPPTPSNVVYKSAVTAGSVSNPMRLRGPKSQRKPALTQQNAIVTLGPYARPSVKLRPNDVKAEDLANLVMPSEDWSVNVYPAPSKSSRAGKPVYTISETLLNSDLVEIVRKSITIQQNWGMKFSVMSHDMSHFNLGLDATDITDIQAVLDNFDSLVLCKGLREYSQILASSHNLSSPKRTQIERFVDNIYRSVKCPLLLVGFPATETDKACIACVAVAQSLTASKLPR